MQVEIGSNGVYGNRGCEGQDKSLKLLKVGDARVGAAAAVKGLACQNVTTGVDLRLWCHRQVEYL